MCVWVFIHKLKLVSVRFYIFDNVDAFLKSCLLLPYDCATTVASECIDRASEGLNKPACMHTNMFKDVYRISKLSVNNAIIQTCITHVGM